MQKYKTMFFKEARLLLSSMEQALLQEEAKEEIFPIYRKVHTLKGMAQIMGYEELIKECHIQEEILGKQQFNKEQLRCFVDKATAILDKEEKPEIVLTQRKGLDISDRDFNFIADKLHQMFELTNKYSSELGAEISFLIRDIYTKLLPGKIAHIGELTKFLTRLLSTFQRNSDKKINFSFEGQEILINRSILNVLLKSLVQLVRNALSHAYETPEERKTLGKKAVLNIEIKAQMQGEELVIQVKDDGRGIDYEALKERLFERKFFNKKELQEVQENKTLNQFLFYPELSTMKESNNYSGRGMGLNEVRELIQGLGGLITVRSEEQQGTTFTIRIVSKIFHLDVKQFKAGPYNIGVPSGCIKNICNVDKKTAQQKASLMVDFMHYFEQKPQETYACVETEHNGKQFILLFENTQEKENLLVVNQQKELFWKGFTQSAQPVFVLNMNYLFMNY